MKTKRLSLYIESALDKDAACQVIDVLEQQNIRYVSFDEGLHILHIALLHVCSRRIVNKIMRRFLNHELKRGRISEFDRDSYIELYGYECPGCMKGRTSPIHHMEYNGCLFQDENEFWNT